MKVNSTLTSKTHISLNVQDVSASVEFYQRLFGTDPVKLVPAAEKGQFVYAKFDLASPPLNLTLNQAVHNHGGTLSHLGIQVASTEDVLKIRDRWTEAGLVTADEMNVDCCYALQDKSWARDPDGNRWEVFTVLENTAPAEVSAPVCCTPAQNASTIGTSEQPCC